MSNNEEAERSKIDVSNEHDYMNKNSSIMSVLDWFITFGILIIPIVGIVMIFVWAFSENGKKDRINFAKAFILFVIALIVINVVFYIIIGALGGA